ncbi:FAD-dependent monooxygenase [Marinococcus luteus]|uniref:FAD-dependent monooxygenase n=1 Tax=Marinococcus luteus TaxID=1122204 RepID=UPI002ACCCA0F|nr:FAD-dependent monooxygenase [Marinococcus luteus]MDZ5784381.1 FAD-dependent monooxygenase [Marinococcus luteus]
MKTTNTDVCIVGAGPVGLTAANTLRALGIRVRILDRKSSISPFSKAFGLQARTLEMLSLIGALRPFLKEGFPITDVAVQPEGKRASRASFASLDTPFPFMLMLPQSDTEHILKKQLREIGQFIDWNTHCKRITQYRDYAEVECSTENGHELIRASYVIGCDGPHSTVRENMNVSFPGGKHDTIYFLGDVTVEGIPLSNDISTFITERGVAAFFPFRDETYRVITIDHAEQNREHRDDLPLEDLERSVQRITQQPVRLTSASWLSQFGTSHHQADAYRDKRLFLAGDAAHLHSPFGGQGMNLGMQDAVNLCWKLAWVLRGHSDPALLDTYEEERYAVGRKTIRMTNTAMQVMTRSHTLIPRLLANPVSMLSKSSSLQRKLTQRLANIDISYQNRASFAKFQHQGGMIPAGARAAPARVLTEEGEHADVMDFLHIQQFTCLFYIEDEQELHQLDESIQEVRRQYGPSILILVVQRKGILRASRPNIHHLFDYRRDLAVKWKLPTFSAVLIRPDGYVAFAEHPVRTGRLMRKIHTALYQ